MRSIRSAITMPVAFFAAIICGSFVVHGDGAAEGPSGEAYFERHVRPLLAEKCFSCHGRGQQKGGLSLDSRVSIISGGDSGAAAVPGKPEASLLIAAIQYAGDIQMPPDNKLSARETAILTRWVQQGLPWPDTDERDGVSIRVDGEISEQDRRFWSFRPVHLPPLPVVRRASWPLQALDHFVLARLESEGLEPVQEADRRTFIRRASFDLLGLPPDESLIAEFTADTGPDAYERLIDRLLDSPHYGERWARHWLDVARYGEDQAHTFQARKYPQGYRYRDWVVEAFNQDLPIDRFLMEQIAADLLPAEDRLRHLPALGYFALGPVYYSDAGCAPKAKADEYDDRIDTLCRGMLGLTVACARCHDHKFDPVSMQDYYALAGVFASTEYLEVPLAAVEVVKAYDDAQAAIRRAEELSQQAAIQAARQLGESFAARTADYLLAAWRLHNHRRADPEHKSAAVVDGTDLHDFLVDQWLQYLQSDAGSANKAFAVWHQIASVRGGRLDPGDDGTTEVIWQLASEIESRLTAAIDARREADARYLRELQALAENEAKPEKPALPVDVAGLLKDLVDGKQSPLAIPAERLETLLPADRKQGLAALRADVEALQNASPPRYPAAHSLTEGKPVSSRIHRRGNVADQGDEVPRRFLAILSDADSSVFIQGSGRLELARAIASPENPLTARVFVNRVWHYHFGRGIVGTPGNFGLLGERPTHPELLDYLAHQFVAGGWSLKQLHRTIMLSATYRLASTGNPTNDERDPDNRLLWRMNRRRLDIESWRDSLLAVTGRLDPQLGGPSLSLSDDDNRRRTLYAAVSRHELHPVLRLFDFPDPNLTSDQRSLTTVPMQQLFVLNSDFMVRQARALAARLQDESSNGEVGDNSADDARIDRLYGWIFGRSAAEHERRLGRDFLGRDISGDDNTAQLSRLEQYVQALLSTNEFLFVD